MIKQTLFTIILLLLTIVIVKSQQNIFLIPRHINLELLDLKMSLSVPRQNATSEIVFTATSAPLHIW